jgi:hypothetical protein
MPSLLFRLGLLEAAHAASQPGPSDDDDRVLAHVLGQIAAGTAGPPPRSERPDPDSLWTHLYDPKRARRPEPGPSFLIRRRSLAP